TGLGLELPIGRLELPRDLPQRSLSALPLLDLSRQPIIDLLALLVETPFLDDRRKLLGDLDKGIHVFALIGGTVAAAEKEEAERLAHRLERAGQARSHTFLNDQTGRFGVGMLLQVGRQVVQ